MKKLFIPAYSNINIEPLIKKIKLKEKLGLVSSIQFLPQLKKANKILNEINLSKKEPGIICINFDKPTNKIKAILPLIAIRPCCLTLSP